MYMLVLIPELKLKNISVRASIFTTLKLLAVVVKINMLKPETTSTLTQGSGIHLSESCYKCSKNTFMTRSKEEQSGGTVDLAQILQTTNLVGLFGLLKTEFLFYLLKGPNPWSVNF